MDGTVNTYPDILFFKNLGNEYTTRKSFQGAETNACNVVADNWGDIEFGPELTNSDGPVTAVINHSLPATRLMSSEYYSFMGKKMADSRISVSSVAVVRHTGLSGQSRIVRLSVTRQCLARVSR
jgi:hypothetical protein